MKCFLYLLCLVFILQGVGLYSRRDGCIPLQTLILFKIVKVVFKIEKKTNVNFHILGPEKSKWVDALSFCK